MNTTLPRTLRRFAGIALAMLPALALAHGDGAHDHGVAEAFFAGLSHPLTGLDHLFAMLALGVWSALALKRAWLAPLAFVAALLAGAGLAMAGLSLPAIEPMIAASLLVLGLLTASRAPLPAAAGMAVAAVFAVFHGAAHGQELQGGAGAAALAGMVLTTAALHAAGIGIGVLMRDRSPWIPRVAGAAVAVFGAALLVPLAV